MSSFDAVSGSGAKEPEHERIGVKGGVSVGRGGGGVKPRRFCWQQDR